MQLSDDREQHTLRETSVGLESGYVKRFLNAEFCLPGVSPYSLPLIITLSVEILRLVAE